MQTKTRRKFVQVAFNDMFGLFETNVISFFLNLTYSATLLANCHRETDLL